MFGQAQPPSQPDRLQIVPRIRCSKVAIEKTPFKFRPRFPRTIRKHIDVAIPRILEDVDVRFVLETIQKQRCQGGCTGKLADANCPQLEISQISGHIQVGYMQMFGAE